jgi:hypothetical protein
MAKVLGLLVAALLVSFAVLLLVPTFAYLAAIAVLLLPVAMFFFWWRPRRGRVFHDAFFEDAPVH